MNLWQSRYFPVMLAFLLFSVAPPGNVLAESAISCHCFQERTFNPAEPFAADDYILATSFNSLLARAFAIPKRKIVMLKMKEGVGQNDLLVGLKIAKVTGGDLQQLLDRRRKKHAWPAIIAALPQKEKIHNDRLLAAIGSGMPVEEAGAGIADEFIGNFYAVPPAAIQEFRMSGLNEKEIALVFILAHISGQQPEALVAQHNKEGKSWSAIADRLGVEPAAAGKLILRYPAGRMPE